MTSPVHLFVGLFVCLSVKRIIRINYLYNVWVKNCEDFS